MDVDLALIQDVDPNLDLNHDLDLEPYLNLDLDLNLELHQKTKTWIRSRLKLQIVSTRVHNASSMLATKNASSLPTTADSQHGPIGPMQSPRMETK